MDKKKVTVSVRIDKDVKEKFESVCHSIGLNISDAINIFARKVVSEQAIPFEVKMKKDKSYQEKLDILFPPASAEEVRELEAKLRHNENEEKPVMVDSSGQRNIGSRFAHLGKINHDNLLGVVPVKGEEE